MAQKLYGAELPWTTILTNATTVEFHPVSGWMPVDPKSMANARGWCEVRGIQGTGMQVAPAIQTANDVRSPDSQTEVMASVTTNGVKDPDATFTSLTVIGKRFIRFGFSVKVTSGTGSARVGGRIELVEN